MHSEKSSAICFNLDQSKILFGNGLTEFIFIKQCNDSNLADADKPEETESSTCLQSYIMGPNQLSCPQQAGV